MAAKTGGTGKTSRLSPVRAPAAPAVGAVCPLHAGTQTIVRVVVLVSAPEPVATARNFHRPSGDWLTLNARAYLGVYVARAANGVHDEAAATTAKRESRGVRAAMLNRPRKSHTAISACTSLFVNVTCSDACVVVCHIASESCVLHFF